MKGKCGVKIVLLAILFLQPLSGFSQTLNWKGMLAGWITANDQKTTKPQLGIRYLPEFSLAADLAEGKLVDMDFSLNALRSGEWRDWNDVHTTGIFKPYRAWIRYSTPRFEARLGLQKINFGSASMLRPLMWFDRLDPRDPLQITDGVYAVLLRYYFLNNGNIWLWGLYGNDDTKGWEVYASKKDVPEFGGRWQFPLFHGELALSAHHRRMLVSSPAVPAMPESDKAVPEDRMALDGKWDYVVGFWIEGTLTHAHSDSLPFPYQRALNVGMDYTVGIGNGLNVMGEFFHLASSQAAFTGGESLNMSALLFRYPLGLFDSLSAIFYYDWKAKNLYSFFQWQRTYDRWIFNLIAFWNPQQLQLYANQSGAPIFEGVGLQVMVVFNH